MGEVSKNWGVLFSNLSLRLMVTSLLSCKLPASVASFQHFFCDPSSWLISSVSFLSTSVFSIPLARETVEIGALFSLYPLFTLCFPICQFHFLVLLTLNIGTILGSTSPPLFFLAVLTESDNTS